jgi:hypothetical protein
VERRPPHAVPYSVREQWVKKHHDYKADTLTLAVQAAAESKAKEIAALRE